MGTSQKYYAWDCWTIFEPRRNLFHVFQLFAEQKHKDNEVHDKFSRLRYTSSPDIGVIKDIDKESAFEGSGILPTGNDTSIWTGCVIRHPTGRVHLYYTERSGDSKYWANQSIRCATTDRIESGEWHVEEMRLTPDSFDPDESRFLRRPKPNDRTVHAWRDPYVFGVDEEIYMLVAAKNARVAHPKSACVALLRATDRSLLSWELVKESLLDGEFEELEVPQIYIDAETHEAVLIASTWDEEDYAESMKEYDPFINAPKTSVRNNGYVLEFRARDIKAALSGRFGSDRKVLVPSNKLYAGIVVPEQGGAIIGFEVGSGDPSIRHGKLPNLRHPDARLRTL